MAIKSFENSRITITGAGSGIGKELVRQLYSSTTRIFAVDISAANLEKLAEQLSELSVMEAADLVKMLEEKCLSKLLEYQNTKRGKSKL